MKFSKQKCPCQSDKAMNECCFTKKVLTLEEHWTAIKARVLQTFIVEHPTDLEKLAIQKWLPKDEIDVFSYQMDQLTMDHLVADVFFFTENREQWSFHLIKCMKEIVQPRTHVILNSWQNPYYFIGEILGSYEGYLILKHIWTDEVIYLADVEIEDKIEGDILLGHIVPGVHPRFYNLLSSAIVLDSEQESILEGWIEQFEASEFTDLESFYEARLVYCLIQLMTEMTLIEEEEKVPNLDILQLIISLDMELLDLGIATDRLPFIFFNYIVQQGETLKIRKQQALVAAAIDYGMNNDLIEKVITQKKLSEKYKVAPSTIANYSRKISYYVDQYFDSKLFDKIHQPMYTIGTDASEEEYLAWQKERQLEKMVFTNNFERKRMEKKIQGIPFKPIKAADKAQKYAYEAYLSSSKEKRYELARQAYMNDPFNLDANLILHEKEPLEKRLILLENGHLHPMYAGSTVRITYLHVTLLYRLGRFSEALNALKTLSMVDIQKHALLKYFLPLLELTQDQKLTINEEMFGGQDSTPLSQWVLSILANYNKEEKVTLFQFNAIQANPFVQKYIELGIQPYDFPHRLRCSYGDPNEAKIIHFLLYPFVR